MVTWGSFKNLHFWVTSPGARCSARRGRTASGAIWRVARGWPCNHAGVIGKADHQHLISSHTAHNQRCLVLFDPFFNQNHPTLGIKPSHVSTAFFLLQTIWHWIFHLIFDDFRISYWMFRKLKRLLWHMAVKKTRCLTAGGFSRRFRFRSMVFHFFLEPPVIIKEVFKPSRPNEISFRPWEAEPRILQPAVFFEPRSSNHFCPGVFWISSDSICIFCIFLSVPSRVWVHSLHDFALALVPKKSNVVLNV